MQQRSDRLPHVVGTRLYNAVVGLTPAGWRACGPQLEASLVRAGLLLAALRGCGSLTEYLQRLTGGRAGGGPCTRVWTAGTFAYRCHTCGLSPSAAICVDCFKASDHAGHNYQLYTSEAGGCCDCGDTSSWRPQGCCPHHRAWGERSQPAPLPPAEEVVARGVVGCALARLQLALEQAATSDAERGAAMRLMAFLNQLGQQPALRAVICDELLQPAAAAAAVQAGSLGATAHLQQEAASVARTLQQHREALLSELEGRLPNAAAGGDAARPLPPLPGAAAPLPLLFWQLSTLLALPPEVVEELTTLLILLLYSVPFKEAFGCALLAFYPHIGALGKRHAVTKALDRLTVQVFHLEETCVSLTRRHRLLEVLLDCLLGVLRRAATTDGRVSSDSPELAGRLYLRIAADLSMCLSHAPVVLELLSPAAGPRAAALFVHKFLEVFRLLQGANPVRRQLGDHVLYESSSFLNTVQLEVHAMHMLKQGALHTLLKATEEGSVPPETTAAALLYGLQRCLEAVEAAAGPLQAAEDVTTFWQRTLSGHLQMSAHLPLERLAATFLAALLHLGTTAPDPAPFLEAASKALGTHPEMAEEQRAQAALRWQMCGLAAARVLSWMSQIRHRLWVRNGQQLLRMEAFYTSPYWSDHAQDCDLVAVQAWLATTPNLSRALGFLACDSGGALIVRASGETTLAAAAAVLQDSVRQPPEVMRCCTDWLRLLVQVLRERACWHPTYSPLPLRRALVQTLAVGPCSHSQLEDELPYELAHSPLLDQVLAQAADYRPPTAASTGQYSLKRECWREFDPFYLHYTTRHLQAALHTAQESGAWQPEWQLQLGLPPLPGPMVGLQRMLHHLLRIVWAVLVAACISGPPSSSGDTSAGGGAAEDSALAAISLLSLALQRKAADLESLISGDQPVVLLSPAWASLAGFSRKCEELLVGNGAQRPGIIFLLRVLAGTEPWVDGNRREASPELKTCAAAAVQHAQRVLQTAQQHAGSQPQADSARTDAVAASGVGACAAVAATGTAAVAAAAQALKQKEQHADRKQHGKQRQQQVLARMRAQQSKAAAALLADASDDEAEAAAMHAVPAGNHDTEAMDLDASGQAAGDELASTTAQRLPVHHPAAWEAQSADCALCHMGSEAGPLGLVGQLNITSLPVLSAVDPATPLTPERPGQLGGSLAPAASVGMQCSAAIADVYGGDSVAPFPATGVGPRLSVFDQQPSMQLLCCGHVLHAECLARYRKNWHQRIASGQVVEGFQLLQPARSSGEYLCPICRRLGNCLLPLAGGCDSLPKEKCVTGQPELAVADAVRELKELLSTSNSWIAAPVTTNAALVRAWQLNQPSSSADPREEPHPAADLPPVVLALRPCVGSQAECVAKLCTSACRAASTWMLQQYRLLQWLQSRVRDSGHPLWGIFVQPKLASATRAEEEPSTLQAALQELVQRAAAADDPEVGLALNAIAQAALAAADQQQLQETQDGSSGSEDDEGLHGRGGEAAAEQPAQLPQQAGTFAGAVQAPVLLPRGSAAFDSEQSAASALRQHNERFAEGTNPGSLLWSLLAAGIVQWEVAHRDSANQPSVEVDAAQWRALQSLSRLAMAAGSPVSCHSAALEVLDCLAEGRAPGDFTCVSLTAALLPVLLQLEMPPSVVDCSADAQDPYALLLGLLAALLSPEERHSGLTLSVFALPASLLELLIAAVYPAAVGQAVALCSGSQLGPADVVVAMAASAGLARALESATDSQLSVFLQRAALLLDLLQNKASPSPVPQGAAPLRRRLRLPSLIDALQSPAAASLLPVRGSRLLLPGSLELSFVVDQHRWTVCSPLQPQAAKLLQLPTSYQDWYLLLGDRACSVCSKKPSEPALCLRCGVIVCCGSRTCKGPSQQGMCFTHSLACGGGACCFLLTKMTRLLIIRKNRATFLASPYVDAHGEEDLRLSRGKPLFLHADRLRYLVQLWRGAAFDFDSHVLHAANHRNEFASAY